VGKLYELEFCSVEIYPDLQISIKADFIGEERKRQAPGLCTLIGPKFGATQKYTTQGTKTGYIFTGQNSI